MEPLRVFLDTCVLKFSATCLPRFIPRQHQVNWGGRIHEMTAHDFVEINPNHSITNPELRSEAELLPRLAEAGKSGNVRYMTQVEAEFESWGIRNMDSSTGKFYSAPIEHVDAPIQYSRVLLGCGVNGKEMQFDFLSGIKNERFIELQKMTGAYQGIGKFNRNQLLDAFHLWCAEHNQCDYFLTLDFSLCKMVRNNRRFQSVVKVVRPSQLLEKISSG